jgi:hypothetical protein
VEAAPHQDFLPPSASGRFLWAELGAFGDIGTSSFCRPVRNEFGFTIRWFSLHRWLKLIEGVI